MTRAGRCLGLCAALSAAALIGAPSASAARGPCTDAARAAMPAGGGHDHLNIAQHRLRCRMRQVAFLSLRSELGARPDVVLGEMDVKKGLAAVLVTYPEAGFLLFDVSDPSRPRFLSWFRSDRCDTNGGPNCGTFVDVSRDGKTVYLSHQDTSPVPGLPIQDPIGLPFPYTGVEVVDVSNPRRPESLQGYRVNSVGGVHTVRSHIVPSGPEGAGREPGEYVFSLANGIGIDIARVERSGGRPELVNVTTIPTDLLGLGFTFAVHDTFIQNDPITRRTYLYIASGLYPGFVIYDVTAPSIPEYIAEWDLTPECFFDWYAHTIDVTHRGSKRYVTLPAELFDEGEQPQEDQSRGCGRVFGSADKVGPLWIIDASDFSKLADGPDQDQSGDEYKAELKRRSQEALVATWTNPAGRAGGNLLFSPHNQQIVGDRIYLSHYHGGVYVLDASAAFAGRKERPAEVGFVVPSDTATRPLYRPVSMQDDFLAGHLGRPDIWDAAYYKGHVLAADMVGGLYSFESLGAPGRPRLRLRLRYRRGRMAVRLRSGRVRRRCARSAVRARVVGRDRHLVRRTTFYVGKRTVRRDRKAPFRVRIARRKLRLGKVNRVRAKVRLTDGRRATLKRKVRACPRQR